MSLIDLDAVLFPIGTAANDAKPAKQAGQISNISVISSSAGMDNAGFLDTFPRLVQSLGAEQGILIEAGQALAMLSPEGRQAVQAGGVDSAGLTPLAEGIVQRVMIERGLVPAGWLAVVVCEQCGPVWLAPESGPAVPACPWCWLYSAGRYFPRPAVQCGECHHFTRNTINPGGGLGDCKASARRPGLSFPHTKKPCPAWRPI
jgi:hypothetical protein